MGYCYCKGKLVCDCCGKHGGVLKRPCPWGACPAPALCPACWEDPKTRADFAAFHVEHGCSTFAQRMADIRNHPRYVKGGV